MKAISFICALAVLGMFFCATPRAQATDLVQSPKLVYLKGSWFLRGPTECAEIKFNRQGRADLILFNREAYIDKTPDYLYLTIREYQKTYTYQMNPLVYGDKYALELVTVGPNQPPISSTPLKEKYTGIFRTMVDCQIGPPDAAASSSVTEQAVSQP